MRKKLLIGFVFCLFFTGLRAQFLMDLVDTTKDLGKGMFSIYKKFDRIRIGGYLQPEFQAGSSKGERTFHGGDFPQHVDNRFTLRRGRIRFDYARFNDNNQPSVQFVFQFDGTERGVFIRDFWGRYYENKWQLFSFSAGMFARPFGYEVNLGSNEREAPERGRMSQLLMKTERDLGAMISFEPRKKNNPLHNFKLDIGLFNGQGLSAVTDYDSYKDIIARASLKPTEHGPFILSAGLSYYNGGFLQNTKYINRAGTINGVKTFVTDSSLSNLYSKVPRKYAGADFQVKLKRNNGLITELRAEYWQGRQTATAGSSETPAVLLTEPSYIRKFNGAYLYLLYNIFNAHHQLLLKYDWYDPNTSVKESDIGKPGATLSATDIKYSTLGVGYLNYINENLKLTLYYEFIKNKDTQLAGYTTDVKDNVFICRLQFRF